MQYILLILLIMMLLSPVLLLPFMIILLLILPIVLLFQSIQILIWVPVSLWQTFTNKQVRRNHALEHATANVLEQRYGYKRVAGMAFKDGFMLCGELPSTGILVEAAREGLERLKRGETDLALHPRCGTSLVVGQFFVALFYLIVFFASPSITIAHIVLGILLYIWVAKPLGLLAQKYITTSTDVQNVHFTTANVDPWGRFHLHTGTSFGPLRYANSGWFNRVPYWRPFQIRF